MSTSMKTHSGLDDHLFLSAQRESESLKERLLELYLLYTISKTFNVSLQAAGIFEDTVSFLKNALNIDKFCLMLLDEKSEELEVWNGDQEAMEAVGEVRFKLGEGISGLVAQSGEAILVQDVSREPRFLHYKGRLADIGSFLSVPLLTKNKQVLGVLNIHKAKTHGFRASDKNFFGAVAHNLAHALERARRYEDATRESMFDDLTRLYNRRFFLDCAHREQVKSRRHDGTFSILMLDVDHFKAVNDGFGHVFGDQVLTRLAGTIKACVRQSDVVARYGGEEFVILLPGTDARGARCTAEKIRALVEREMTFEPETDRPMRITVTIGVASYPDAGKTIDEMISTADRRLYLGKRWGRNRVVTSERDPALDPVQADRRRHARYRTALRIVRDSQQVNSIDIRLGDNDWALCALMDVSNQGFNSLVNFEPHAGAKYMCRAVAHPRQLPNDLFAVQVRHVEPIAGDRFLIGVQVGDEHAEVWNKVYATLAR